MTLGPLDTVTPYPKRLDDKILDAVAERMGSVWNKPGASGFSIRPTYLGIIEAAAWCRLKHPSQMLEYHCCAVVWTQAEWDTISTLTREFDGLAR